MSCLPRPWLCAVPWWRRCCVLASPDNPSPACAGLCTHVCVLLMLQLLLLMMMTIVMLVMAVMLLLMLLLLLLLLLLLPPCG